MNWTGQGIDIDIMANATKRPQDVAVTHFFAPANVMKLFEVVKGAKSAPDTLATAMDLGRKIGKISAMAGNGDGFVPNRSLTSSAVPFKRLTCGSDHAKLRHGRAQAVLSA